MCQVTRLLLNQLTDELIWSFIKITGTLYDKNQTIREKKNKVVKPQVAIRYLTLFKIKYHKNTLHQELSTCLAHAL